MKKISVILLIIFLVGCTKQLLIKDYPYKPPSIPMFGQIPERSFFYHVDLPDSLELKWEESLKGSLGNNSVVTEDKYVFVSDLAGNIFCYDADTSKVVGADKGSGEIAVAPLLNSGFVYYVITESGESYSQLISYDIRKGKRKKEIEIPGRVGNEMILFNDSFFFISDNGIAYKYNFNLNKLWEVDLESEVYSSPASSKNKILIATLDGNIISIDFQSGKINYTKKISNGFEAGIVINGDVGYVGDIDGNLIAFDIDDGEKFWGSKTNAKIKAPAVHNQKYIYSANLAGSLYCFDINNGDIIWNLNTDGIFNTPAALFNNVLVQPDLNEKLLFINPMDGNIVKTMEYEARVKFHPVYYNKMLYVGIDRGELLAYKCVDVNK